MTTLFIILESVAVALLLGPTIVYSNALNTRCSAKMKKDALGLQADNSSKRTILEIASKVTKKEVEAEETIDSINTNMVEDNLSVTLVRRVKTARNKK